jgi:ABC-type sugar transport system ATPase subunit
MDMVLETDRLGKRYGRSWALRDCSLHLPAGHIAALVGHNGAGKTTLPHLAVGLLRPDAGEARILGRSPYNEPTVLAEVRFVGQDAPLYRDFTAAELVVMGGRLNRRWDPDLARDRLARLGIPPGTPVGKLSVAENVRHADGEVAFDGRLQCGPDATGPDGTPCGGDLGVAADAYNWQLYQPADRYWLFQGIETGIFAVLAVLLLYLPCAASVAPLECRPRCHPPGANRAGDGP